MGFQDLKELARRIEGDFSEGWSARTRVNGFRLTESRVRWDIGKELFPGRVGRPWHRVPRAAVAVLDPWQCPRDSQG